MRGTFVPFPLGYPAYVDMVNGISTVFMINVIVIAIRFTHNKFRWIQGEKAMQITGNSIGLSRFGAKRIPAIPVPIKGPDLPPHLRELADKIGKESYATWQMNQAAIGICSPKKGLKQGCPPPVSAKSS